MVRRHVPRHGTAPVVADPHGALATERRQQLQNVGDDQLLREILVATVAARPAIAAHVGCDAAKPSAANTGNWCRQESESSGQPWTKIRSGAVSAPQARLHVAGGLDGVFGGRKCHGEGPVNRSQSLAYTLNDSFESKARSVCPSRLEEPSGCQFCVDARAVVPVSECA